MVMLAADTSATLLGWDTRIDALLIAIISLVVSVWSLVNSHQAKRLSERESAKTPYRRYLELGLQNPRFVTENPQTGFVEYNGFSGEDATSYRMFVAILLNACEEILERSNDKDWRAAVSRQLRQHRPYLSQMAEERCAQYDKRIREVLRPLVGGNW
jgi:hypothetical protein